MTPLAQKRTLRQTLLSSHDRKPLFSSRRIPRLEQLEILAAATALTGTIPPFETPSLVGQPAEPLRIDYADDVASNDSKGGGSPVVALPTDEITPERLAALLSLESTAPPTALPVSFVLLEDPLSDPLVPPPSPPMSNPPSPTDPPNTQSGNTGGSTSLVTPPPTPPQPGAPPPTPPPSIVPPPPMMAPVAMSDLYALSGQSPYHVDAGAGVLSNDMNPSGGPMFATLVSSTSHGTIALGADGSYTYTPMAGYAGTDSFSYQATANGLTSNVASVSLSVLGSTLTAHDDSYSVLGGTMSLSPSGVLGNDTYTGTGLMSATLVGSASHGTVTLAPDGSCTYTADAGYTGTDSFTYRATAGGLTSNVATVTLEIAPWLLPVANDDAFTVSGGILSVPASGVLGNDTNAHGLPMSVVLVTSTSHGTTALNADGSFNYTANAGYSGTDSFTYHITEAGLTSNDATVRLTVNGSTPTAPTANDDEFTLMGGASSSIPAGGVLDNDDNPGGQTMTASLVGFASHGMVMLSQDGSFTYVPNLGYLGSDSFTYTAMAGGLTSNVAIVTLTVTAPTANDDIYALPSDGVPLVILASSGVVENDDVPAGQPLMTMLDTAPSHGMVMLSPDGAFTYTADAAYHGTDSFTYRVSVGGLTSNVATVTLLVGLAALPDSYAVQHDDILQTTDADGVLANDSNAGGTAPTAHLVSGPLHGMLNLNADGSFDFTPTAGYVGADSFIYEALADDATSGPVVVSLDVTDVAPDAPDTSYDLHAGQTLQVEAPGLAAVASDPDTQDTLHFVLEAGPVHGQLQFAADGTFTYQPNQGFVGTDSFDYHTNDGALNSPAGRVTISVTDAAPLAGDRSFDVAANGVLNDPTTSVLSNTADPDGDFVTARLLAGPSHAGQFTFNADGTFVYAPATNFVGTDTFTFVANDGTLDSAPATVTINVSAGAMAHDHYYFLPASGPLTISAADGLLNDAFDPTGYPITAVVVGQPSSGTVQVNADGSFVYTPPVGGAADVTFNFTIPLAGGGLGGRIALAILAAAQPKISLVSEDFTNANPKANYLTVKSITADDASKVYRTGWSAQQANTRNPLALVAEGTFNLKAEFSIDRPQVVQGIQNKLTFLGTSTFLAPALLGVTPTVTLAGNTLTVTWVGAKAPAKASVNDLVDQQWVIGGIPSVILTAGGTAKHQIYVLAGTPTVGKGSGLFHTVVRVGTLAAQGLAANTAAAALQVSAAIVKAFEGRNLFSAEGPTYFLTPFGQTGFLPLQYYGKWSATGSDTTASLVATGDGDCSAWSDFFMDVVKTQGVTLDSSTLKIIKVDQAAFAPATFPLKGRKLAGETMFVKGWVLKPGATASNTFKEKTPIANSTTEQYQWVKANVTFDKSIPCQGMTRPLAVFGSHRVLQINIAPGATGTILFDPSYGTRSVGETPADRLLAWQNKSLDFVGLDYDTTRGNPTDPNTELRMQAITSTTKVLYMKYLY